MHRAKKQNFSSVGFLAGAVKYTSNITSPPTPTKPARTPDLRTSGCRSWKPSVRKFGDGWADWWSWHWLRWIKSWANLKSEKRDRTPDLRTSGCRSWKPSVRKFGDGWADPASLPIWNSKLWSEGRCRIAQACSKFTPEWCRKHSQILVWSRNRKLKFHNFVIGHLLLRKKKALLGIFRERVCTVKHGAYGDCISSMEIQGIAKMTCRNVWWKWAWQADWWSWHWLRWIKSWANLKSEKRDRTPELVFTYSNELRWHILLCSEICSLKKILRHPFPS